MTSRIMAAALAVIAALSLSACYHHNFPQDIRFAPTFHIAEKAHVYVDMNGTFYPEGWNAFVPPRQGLESEIIALRGQFVRDCG